MEESKGSTQEFLRQKLALIPNKPGCYLMKNREGKIIYVGKAKVLKNRVRSYFSGSHDGKTQRMVSEIADFEYIVTSSDMEALLLECNLIKKHKPRYNVLLKDDKTYPYIKLTNEEHPRLEVTRKVLDDKGKYFGPYPSAFAAHKTKRLLDRLVPLRKCKTMPDRVCLYYHIGQCLGPCQYEVTREENERMVEQVLRFLRGGYNEIRNDLTRQMHEAAEQLQFEKAKELRDLIADLDTIMEKQSITVADAVDRDIFGYAVDKGWMCVQILYMRQGKIIERHASIHPYYGEEYEDFISFVTQYYSDNPALPGEILLPSLPAKLASKETNADMLESGGLTDEGKIREMLEKWLRVKVRLPKRGEKRKLVDMAVENAKVALEEKLKLMDRNEERTIKAVENLGRRLGIGPVRRIEAFDNSNIQGTHPVSAMVVFVDGKPERKEYRKYKVKTVQGPDDVATMREIIRRRYERVLKENLPLPDLILVDGGKGQLSAAKDVLENELGLDIPVCGLVKDRRHKTSQLIAGDPPEVVSMERGSQEFYLLQRIQEEVHRFALSFHRKFRGKAMLGSVLDDIPGIGEKRRKKLLRHFGSVQKIKEASVEELKSVGIHEKLARTLLEALKQKNGSEME